MYFLNPPIKIFNDVIANAFSALCKNIALTPSFLKSTVNRIPFLKTFLTPAVAYFLRGTIPFLGTFLIYTSLIPSLAENCIKIAPFPQKSDFYSNASLEKPGNQSPKKII